MRDAGLKMSLRVNKHYLRTDVGRFTITAVGSNLMTAATVLGVTQCERHLMCNCEGFPMYTKIFFLNPKLCLLSLFCLKHQSWAFII